MNDPKLLTAIAALFVSLFNIFYTFINQKKQNERWEFLNKPDIILDDIVMPEQAIYNEDEAMNKINWGYSPEFLIKTPNKENTVSLLYCLKPLNPENNHIIYGANPSYTLDEFNRELVRLKINTIVLIVKEYKLEFKILNNGKIIAENISVEILRKIDDKLHHVFKSDLNLFLSPNKHTVIETLLHLPNSVNFPEKLELLFIIDYKWENTKKTKRQIEISYLRTTNKWYYNKVIEY